jgi:ribosomal protein L14E/L6E/L27E
MFYIDPLFILYYLLLLTITNNICIYTAGRSEISFKYYYKKQNVVQNWEDLDVTKWTVKEQLEKPIQKDGYVEHTRKF